MPFSVSPCTIVSGIASDKSIWIGDNEDYFFDFDTYLNVLPPERNLLGAISFTYDSPEHSIQGGINERGLFFDFNWLPSSPQDSYAGWKKKHDFPGGEEALVRYILRRCSTVLEVEHLLQKYRLPALLGSQMHLADRSGDRAIVTAQGFQHAGSSYLISTNFNLVARDKQGEARCWRFPRANGILQSRGVTYESIRKVLSDTQQIRDVSTIYSVISNLSSGEVWIYYAGEFDEAYHSNLEELLKKGKHSYLFRSLFPQSPIVRVWECYREKGAEQALHLYDQLQKSIPEDQRSQILRHIFMTCLVRLNRYADARQFFQKWYQTGGNRDPISGFYNAVMHLTSGDTLTATTLFARQMKVEEKDEFTQRFDDPHAAPFLFRLMEPPKDANARFVLKGHTDAKFVCMYGLDVNPIYYFLKKTGDGWSGQFELSPGKYNYAFLVDGKILLDSANAKSEVAPTDDGPQRLNILVIPASVH